MPMEEEKTEKIKKESGFKQSLWEFIKFAALAALIVVPIRMWVAQPFIVSGSSMVPNFQNGEYLIVDEFSYKFRQPERGEVIVFRYPQDPSKFFIKRIIGLPNEKVEIKNDGILVFNNDSREGMVIKETYLPSEIYTQGADTATNLGNDEYFVLGDNRPMSSDSRTWGPLKKDLIIGRAWMRLWPFNKAFISF